MEPEYKDILNRRRNCLMNNLTWSDELATLLLEKHLVSKKLLRNIEKEHTDKSRVLYLLAQLPQQPQPGVFPLFIEILQKCGFQELADLLTEDREAVTWDFQSGVNARTISEYIEILQDQLLKRLPGEHDDCIRKGLIAELQKRVLELARLSRNEMHRRNRYRRMLMQLLKDKKIKIDFEPKADINLLDVDGMDSYAEGIEEKELHLLKCVQEQFEELEESNKDLRVEIESQSEYGLVRYQSEMTPVDQSSHIELLEDLVKQKDKDIAVLNSRIRRREKEYEFIPKIEYTRVIELLEPYVRKSSTISKYDITLKDDNLVVHGNRELKTYVTVVLDQVDRLRMRLQQTSNRITELEKERSVTMTRLGSSETDQWVPDIVTNKLDRFNEDKEYMEQELDSLRRRLVDLTSEHQNLIQKIGKELAPGDDLSGSEPDDESLKTRPKRCASGTKPTRKSSAHVKDDVRSRRVTVGSYYLQGSSSSGRSSAQSGVGSPKLRIRSDSNPSAMEKKRTRKSSASHYQSLAK